MCHVSHVTSQIGGASQWRVCYQWGPPRLVFLELADFHLTEKTKIEFGVAM